MAHSTDDGNGTMQLLEKCFDGDAHAATLQLVQKRVRCDERQMCFHDEFFARPNV